MSIARQLPLPMRRNEGQRCVTAQRAAIGDAWAQFDDAADEGEARVRRVVTWTRGVSALAAVLAATVAIRRLARAGVARRVIGVLALAGSAIRFINPARSSFFGQQTERRAEQETRSHD